MPAPFTEAIWLDPRGREERQPIRSAFLPQDDRNSFRHDHHHHRRLKTHGKSTCGSFVACALKNKGGEGGAVSDGSDEAELPGKGYLPVDSFDAIEAWAERLQRALLQAWCEELQRLFFPGGKLLSSARYFGR